MLIIYEGKFYIFKLVEIKSNPFVMISQEYSVNLAKLSN